MKNIKAINNYCIVEMIKPVEVKQGLIILPGSISVTPRWGVVKSVGDGVPDLGGKLQAPDVSEKDTVYVMAHGQYEVYSSATGTTEDFVVTSTLDIMAILNDLENLSIQPLGSYIEVEKIEIDQESEGGLVLPETRKLPTNLGKVISVGLGWRTADNHPIPFQVEVGDTVVYNPLRLMVVDFATLGKDVKKYLVMHGDILGVVKE